MPSITAVYSSPQEPSHTITHPITTLPPASSDPSPDNTQAKIAYFADLRQRASALQDDVNAFLTAQMEADKNAADAQGRALSEKEAQEEANYGEEVVEDDA